MTQQRRQVFCNKDRTIKLNNCVGSKVRQPRSGGPSFITPPQATEVPAFVLVTKALARLTSKTTKTYIRFEPGATARTCAP
eukprot:2954350-Ditylum_brightwellii.AAC.1